MEKYIIFLSETDFDYITEVTFSGYNPNFNI